MKRILLTLCVSALTVVDSMFGVSITQKIKDSASDAARTAKDYVPVPGTSAFAFRSAYDEVMQNIYQLRDQEVILIKEAEYKFLEMIKRPEYRIKKVSYSVDKKLYSMQRIIKLCYDMVDIMTSVTERLDNRVRALKGYVGQEADKMNELKDAAIKNNNFIEIANIAEKLVDYLLAEAGKMVLSPRLEKEELIEKEASRDATKSGN